MDELNPCFETGLTLENLKGVVLDHWESLVREVIVKSRHQPSIILQDHIPELLDQLISILKVGEVDEIELGKAHGFQRAVLTKFSVADLLTEFSLLRETLIDYLYPMSDVHCTKIVHKFIDILCKYSTTEFVNDFILKGSLERQVVGDEVKEIKNNPVIDTVNDDHKSDPTFVPPSEQPHTHS